VRIACLSCRAIALVFFLAAMTADGQAAGAPKTIPLPGDRAFPESISATADGTLYIGSAGVGGVLRVPAGTTKPESWIAPGAFGSKSIFGVLADIRSQTLWVCSNDFSSAGPNSTLIGYDLKSGQGKFKAKLPGAKTLCNDIAIAHDGSVYVTNSAAPQILKLNRQSGQLDVWLTDPQFQPAHGIGLDGIAVASDGTVYVDTYTEGKFFRIPVNDGKPAAPILISISRPLVLADALRPIWGDAFLLVEGAGRLDRITIEGAEAIVDTISDGLDAPTGVARANGTTWVAEGQLPYLFDPAKKGQKPKLPFRLVGVDY
jgi:streptogramin lyase